MRQVLLYFAAALFLPSVASALCPVPTGITSQSAFYNLMPASNGAVYMGRYGDLAEGGLRRREGTFYYNSDADEMMLCDGTNWKTILSSGGSGAGTGTSGTATPSKEKVYGPYSINGTSDQVLAAIANTSASHYEVYGFVETDGGSPGNPLVCRLEVAGGGAWHVAASGSFSISQYNDGGGDRSYSYSGTAYPGVVYSDLQASGNYQVSSGFQRGATKVTSGGKVQYANSSYAPDTGMPTVSTGTFPGRIRTTGASDECMYKVLVKTRMD